MPNLPRAILFDLDDTILVAFGPAESQWRRVLGAYTEHLAPLAPAAAIAAIMDSSRDLWADPARHKHWRHRIGEARRRIVANAFARHWRQPVMPSPSAPCATRSPTATMHCTMPNWSAFRARTTPSTG